LDEEIAMAVQVAAHPGAAPASPEIRKRRDYLPYMLVLPIIAYEVVFILIPIIQQFISSFTSDVIGIGTVEWVGSENYERLFADRNFWNSLRVTFIFMGGTVVLSVGLGLIAALLLNQHFRGRSLARGIMTMPWAIPDLPAVMVFFWILNPNFGVINLFVRWILPIEETPRWLLDINLAMPIVISIAAWKAFPFYGLVTLSVLQSIPHELYEAAKVDGATPLQSFRYVTLPEIVPTLMLMGVLACIFAFRQFALIFLSTGGGPARTTETLVLSVYKTAFNSFDFSYGATIGVAGFIAVFAITLIFVFLQRRQEALASS
jgi:multiple sugar transport system permease protein